MRYVNLGLVLLCVAPFIGCTITQSAEAEYDWGAYVEGYNHGYQDCRDDYQESTRVTFDEDFRWVVEEGILFSVEECIDRSIHAANNHAKHAYVWKNNPTEHDLYWMNVHNSCAYWLEELGE